MSDQPATTPAQEDILLRLRDAGRTFTMGEVQVKALAHFTLDVPRGEFLAVVGPSGSGKSTVLNLIGGLDQPTSGTIEYQGRQLGKASARELTQYRREEVGFVFQFYNLVANLTARENVQVASDLVKQPRDVDEVLEVVGLSERGSHFPSQLSGGEQQRVAIARAIAKNPELLLCDEPTGALDFETGKRVLRVLVDLNRQWGKTIIVITHNSALASVADRIVHLRSGEITHVESVDVPTVPEEVEW